MHCGVKQQKAFSLCLPFAFQNFVMHVGLEKGTMVISQIDGCGRSHLACWKGVILGVEDQDGNWCILLPLRAISPFIMAKHCVVSLNVGWDTLQIFPPFFSLLLLVFFQNVVLHIQSCSSVSPSGHSPDSLDNSHSPSWLNSQSHCPPP